MDIRYLKYFISVAKHLNFTKAAQECFISQTAMSQHISKMEEELGFKLFYRNNRMVELTAGGKVFLEEAKSLMRKYEYAVFWGSVASMDYRGHLRIGFLSYTEKRFLPKVLRLFHERNPKVEIVLMRGNFSQLSEYLRTNQLDLIVAYPHDMDIPNIVIKKYPLRHLCLVVNKDHPLANEEKVTVEMFKDERFLFVNEEDYPQMHKSVLTVCESMGFQPLIVNSPKDMDSLLLMIELGMGVTFLPPNDDHNPNGALRYLAVDEKIDLIHSVAYLSDNPNPSLGVFLKILDDFDREGLLEI